MKRFNYEPASRVKEYVNGIDFRYYPPERLIIDSIDSRLDSDERKVRFYIMDRIIENGMPFNFTVISEDMQKSLNMTEGMIRETIDSLVAKNAAVSDENQNINFIYPVSGFPTNHKIELADGRKFSAMCAVDGMGCAFTFRQDIKLTSGCSQCGEQVRVEIRNGEIVNLLPEDAHVLHVDLNKNQNWSGSC